MLKIYQVRAYLIRERLTSKIPNNCAQFLFLVEGDTVVNQPQMILLVQ